MLPPPLAQSWALHNLDIWWLIPHYRAKGFSQVCTTYVSKPKGKGGMGTAEINSYITGENWQAFGILHAPMDRKFNINILSVWLMHVFRLQGRVFLISQLSSPWGWGIWCYLNEKCEIPLGLPIPHAGAYHWHVHNMDNVHHNVALGKKANSVIHFWCKPDYHYNVCGENQHGSKPITFSIYKCYIINCIVKLVADPAAALIGCMCEVHKDYIERNAISLTMIMNW